MGRISKKQKQKEMLIEVSKTKWFKVLFSIILTLILLMALYFTVAFFLVRSELKHVTYDVINVEVEKKSANLDLKVIDEKNVVEGYDVSLYDKNSSVVVSIKDNHELNKYITFTFDSLTPNKEYEIGITVYKKSKILPIYIGSKSIKDDSNLITEADDNLYIYSIETRDKYGDALFIKKGDFDMLIDAGEKGDGQHVNQFVKDHISSDNKLDILVVTHAHSDHMGGLVKTSSSDNRVKALDGISEVGTIIDYGHSRSGNTMHESYELLRDLYVSKGAKHISAYEAVKNIDGLNNIIEIEENFKIEIVDTNNYVPKDTNLTGSTVKYNEYSVAILLEYYETKLFAAGDLEDKGENTLVNNAHNTGLNDIKDSDEVLYKACHHGTDVGTNNATTSTNGGNTFPLLKIIKPDVCFVSSAIGQSTHPYATAIANFLYFTDRVYFNGTNGTLEFTLDGSSINVRGFGATTNYVVLGQEVVYADEKDLVYTMTTHYNYSLYDVTGFTIKYNVEQALEKLLNKYPK